jgi:YidC/Oxa1 family membrane protein insertase
MFTLVAWVVEHSYQLIPSYALAIVLLTLAIMVMLTPLTLKSTQSIMQMQRLQPEIQRIREEFKDDRQRLNEELLRFYKEHQISPLGGCVPMLVQLPIYFILYRVLQGLTHLVPDPENAARKVFDPLYLDHTSKLYTALHGQTTMKSFGIDLARNLPDALSGSGLATALPYVVLVAGVAGATLLQQRQLAARAVSTGAANPIGQRLGNVMPLVMVAVCFALPGALVLYILVSTLYRVGQQHIIGGSLGPGPPAPAG